jgi:hypothetical protein
MSERVFLDGKVKLLAGDCREKIKTLPDNSIDSVVCDPPYALVSIVKRFGSATAAAAKSDGATGVYARASAGFMGKQWDTGEAAFAVEFWAEVMRVLKPGGHVLAFSGTRTYHRLACAIEDAGFEIRDQIGWAYGCLDEQTMAVTPSGLASHNALNVGDLVLSYDVRTKSYQWDAVQHVHRYRISDTVFRISTDHGDQIVSRNHRCIVERGGAEVFALAEEAARQRQARVPVLENLPALLAALPNPYKGTGSPEPHMLDGVQGRADRLKGDRATFSAQSARDRGVRSVRTGKEDTASVAAQGSAVGLFPQVQRRLARGGVEATRAQGTSGLEAGIGSRAGRTLHWTVESIMERWRHLSAAARELCERAVCPLPAGVSGHGACRRLCDGAPAGGGSHHRSMFDQSGVCSSHRPQASEQLPDQPHAVCNEQRPQAVRAWAGHKAVVGRITPERYDGVIWCVTIRTGAFVAVRNGMAFPTGNSGFPKSHDVSKAIDKAAGVDREDKFGGAIDRRIGPTGNKKCEVCNKWLVSGSPCKCPRPQDEPQSAGAMEWKGWGTALKPAWEPIVVARKALIGTVAENVLTYGTGAINIDGCRVETSDRVQLSASEGAAFGCKYEEGTGRKYSEDHPGRFPANIILGFTADEYELRQDITIEQKRELYRWLSENA